MLRIDEVDVFGSGPLSGNPLAVVHDADALSTADMQRIARWTNFSETTFLLPPTVPEAAYRVRIFTPAVELPFAGHPTLGTCAAWLAAGGAVDADADVVQECGAGLVAIRRADDRLAFAAPPLVRSGPIEPTDLAETAERFGIDGSSIERSAWVDNGPGWKAFLLDSVDALRAVVPPGGRSDPIDLGLAARSAPGTGSDLEVRAFFTDASGSIREDPVTGSLNASLAQWLLADGVLAAPYVASQGRAVGADGRVVIDRDPSGQVWVGGRAEIVVTGTLDNRT